MLFVKFQVDISLLKQLKLGRKIHLKVLII